MRQSVPDKLERGRIIDGVYGSDASFGVYGAFDIAGPCGERLRILSSGGDETGWEHVSVSTHRRTPNWQEMCFVKDLFWDEEECVMQLHPPLSTWINNHPFCLHLWRPTVREIPLPPSIMVGLKGLEPKDAEAATMKAAARAGVPLPWLGKR